MNRDQRNIIILVVLLVGVVGAVFYSFTSATPSIPSANAPGGAQAGNTTAGAMVESVFEETDVDIEELFRNIKDVEFDYSLVREPRNPMVPLIGRTVLSDLDPDSATASAGNPIDEEVIYRAYQKSLTGIMWDEHDPLAVMNDGLEDIVVYQGFEFPGEGIVVSQIAKDHVVLTLKLAGQQREIIRELTEKEL